MKTLLDLEKNKSCYIKKIHGNELDVIRVRSIGFFEGEKVTFLYAAPFKKHLAYEVSGNVIGLSKRLATKIEIVEDSDAK
ncbi:hypothetical protein ASO20_02215 [Mycoplasma sp. (ex Biomphalaria glabrata)]|uniref:FeoA family protein n=1 Tax=Mycoplasma sp. (ex Biomphalaria glabrata) TaxID=1749074 RepID=UPI00073A8186|nr:FeoA family protein [Mycoplasma sp. (ex Biomphalaria glabrata)]ALV23452.1 hypothetical protein ASO20_02215 [Mycoplasma sp. (ex Biomphalaria glabrata)]